MKSKRQLPTVRHQAAAAFVSKLSMPSLCHRRFAKRFEASALLVLAVALLACNPRSPTEPRTNTETIHHVYADSPLRNRDLSRDEAAGGHTLRKHVSRTNDQLRERLRQERNIAAASTWNDRAGAEAAVGSAIAQQSDKINRWMEREGGHPNLVLDYDGDSSHPFGRTLRRDADRVELCAHATIVLKWDGPNSYHVLTAYPECR